MKTKHDPFLASYAMLKVIEEEKRDERRAKLREEMWNYEHRKLSDAEADEMILEAEADASGD